MTTLTPSRTADPDLIELVLVDDHAMVRQGLRSVLEREPDVRVVGEAGTPAEAMTVVAAARPLVVLLDLKLSSAPGLEGLDLCAQLVAAHPGLAVLVLTTTLEDSLVVAALRNGAQRYVVKEVDTSELRARDPGRAPGRERVRPAQCVGDGPRSLPRGPPGGSRADRPRARGAAAAGPGHVQPGHRPELFISETTAKFHVGNIMRKLDVGRRSEAVYVASQMGAL